LINHPNLTVVTGSVLSPDDMQRAFAAPGKSIDAVIQCLNSPRANDWNPWAKWIGPPRLMADATALAARLLRTQVQKTQQIDGAAAKHIQRPRLIAMNALGTGESRAVSPLATKFIIDYSSIGKTYEDHEAVNSEIEGNCGDEVAWTVVMAAALDDGTGDKAVRTFAVNEKGASFFITRQSCAKWMVDVATGKMRDDFSNRRVIVSN
jgi:hypothetical protein